MTPDELMQLALDAARRGIAAGQTPFGCAIARDNRVLSACHNTVWLSTDITAHAEINAIREACRRVQSVSLEGAMVATTCEPCPMCMAALHWARVAEVHYGATIADAADAGFRELPVAAAELLRQGHSSVRLFRARQTEDCRQLFHQWQQSQQARPY